MVSKKTKKLITFQDAIFNLQNYWSNNGCLILQPYDIEVGAGTFHPATTLRSLGPEKWKAAYVQPSRRPSDGRYGENPNRLQHYYQFQVLIKPSPEYVLYVLHPRAITLPLDTATQPCLLRSSDFFASWDAIEANFSSFELHSIHIVDMIY